MQSVRDALTSFVGKGEPLTLYVVPDVVISVVTSFLLIVLALYVRKSLRKVPGMAQTSLEVVFGDALAYLEKVVGSRAHARALFPFLATVVFSTTLTMLFPLVPGTSAVSLVGGSVPGVTLPLSLPLLLARFVAVGCGLFVLVEGVVARTLGLRAYLVRLVTFRLLLAWARGIFRTVVLLPYTVKAGWVRVREVPFWKTVLFVAVLFGPVAVEGALPVVQVAGIVVAVIVCALVAVHAAGAALVTVQKAPHPVI